MKHSTDFPIEGNNRGTRPALGALPDAPMAMPKQTLERGGSWYSALRALFAGPFAGN